jgi:lipopolysaccharide transport system ATP-binding protein
MYVRLAFAVAAHLEPEILIVDEVLAVGDTQFQLKCLDRIRSIGQSGRTVLFVSHNLSTVRNLCESAILLEKGRLVMKGDSSEVIGRYLSAGTAQSGLWVRPEPVPEKEGVFFERIALSAMGASGTSGGEPCADFESAHTISIRMETLATKRFENVQIGIRITNQEGIPVFTTCNTDVEKRYLPIPKGRNTFSLEIPAILLPHGRYVLAIVSHVPHDRVLELLDGDLSFTVHDTGSHATALKDNRTGVVTPVFAWRMES